MLLALLCGTQSHLRDGCNINMLNMMNKFKVLLVFFKTLCIMGPGGLWTDYCVSYDFCSSH